MIQISLIYDYVDTGGVNAIRAWLDQQTIKAKVKLNTILGVLEQISRTEWRNMPRTTEVLKGDKDGLIAVRVLYDGIQYRMLGYDGPNRAEFTLLACGKEQNRKYIPLDIGAIAFGRKAAIEANPNGRRTRHDFG